MTDEEMLELAAKAAGYEYSAQAGYIVVDGIPGNWDPLTDDGDALRLAVDLGISITFMGETDSVSAEHPRHKVTVIEAMDSFGTRRAIVRAAAEIGKMDSARS